MPITLSLSTNPLINRFAEPDDLIDTVAYRLGVGYLQMTNEIISPSWDAPTISRLTRQMASALKRTGVRVTSGMTGPYARLNHFGHPDKDVRRFYINWFKTFADITASLGGRAVGGQFAIFTFKDFDDPKRREELTKTAIDCWSEVAEHGKGAGLDFVFWEPMSIGREFGETIKSCLALQQRLSSTPMAIPMKMMADIDHGDLSSSNPDDFDPYAWARAVPKFSPIIHIKQSLAEKAAHRPFTSAYNAVGRIQPKPLLESLAAGGAKDNELCLELSFKEREPNDRQVIPDIAESVAFWAPHVDTGANDLNI